MKSKHLLSDTTIISKIYYLRGHKIMLDYDLASIYDVPTKAFNQSVKRNMDRFPEDFMFELSEEEWKNLRSQFVTSSWGGSRYLPKAFTEQGVAMLSSVLKSKTAIDVNIRIIRIFTKFREMFITQKDLLLRLEQLEKQVGKNTDEIKLIFNVLKELIASPDSEKSLIGFRIGNKKS